MNRWPNLYIVGAAKSGTSSLAAYLAQHPEIGVSRRKEPNYFAFRGVNLREMPGPRPGNVLYGRLYYESVTSADEYHLLFSELAEKPILVDASVRYLYSPVAARRIHEVAPDARIIIMLRNPTLRAWSHYSMMRYMYDLEPLGWREALHAEQARIRAGWDFDWHYASVGCYAEQVRRYLELFGSERVRIYWQSSFAEDALHLLRDVFRFVGVDATFKPDLSVREKSGFHLRSLTLRRWFTDTYAHHPLIKRLIGRHHNSVIGRLCAWNRVPLPPPPEGFVSQMAEAVAGDRANLAFMIGKQPPW